MTARLRTLALIDSSTGPGCDAPLGSEVTVDMDAVMLALDGRFRTRAMANRRGTSIESYAQISQCR